MAKKETETPKKLEEYEATNPRQLDLFIFGDLKPQERPRYSHTIELYDFMPKYHWGKVERIGGKFLDSLQLEFECKGVKYKIEITPASIRNNKGVERYYYPSKPEELVEDALVCGRRPALMSQSRHSVTWVKVTSARTRGWP